MLQNLGKLFDKYENQFGTQTHELSMLRDIPFYNFVIMIVIHYLICCSLEKNC